MTQRVEPDLTSTWAFDTAAHGIGKLASASATTPGCPGCAYQKSFAYDGLSRPVQVTFSVNGGSTVVNFFATYDANSRLSTVTYPSGFVATYTYTSLGYAQQVSGGSQLYWQANVRDAELRLTSQTAGNGIVTTQNFDPLTDRLTSILAGAGNAVESFSYTYDAIGNVLTRADANESLTETFTYDSLNRLLSATVSANIAPQKLFSYDPVGNLLSKSDVGTYTYPLAGSALPHAVSAVNGTINSTFTYDPNGNQTAGNGRSTTYTSYNMPVSITGANTISFSYDMDHQRFWREAGGSGTIYLDAFGVHAEAIFSATVTWQDYLSVGGSMVAMRVLQSNSVATRYFHTDNLGSLCVLTDETGTVVERDGYDAWGKRRFANGADDPNYTMPGSQTRPGFTGQEYLGLPHLVHLNGRLYDPLIGRMISADPMVPDPLNGQAWNRYSYVVNNPLAFTDPSGYCFLGLCGVGNIFTNIGKDIRSFLQRVPIVGTILEVAAAAICPAVLVCAVTAAFLSTTAVSGIESGSLKLGLKAGLIAAATAVAFWEVGNLTQPNGANAMTSAQRAENIVGHALVGCGQAVASGGKCGPSALAGAVTSAAGPVINGYGVASLVANATLGGGAAVLGGGKFENGAITSAFGYIFNNTFHFGVTGSIPGLIAQGLTYIYQSVTGDTHWVMGSSGYAGVTFQYESDGDRAAGLSVPTAFGVYYGGSVPGGDSPPVSVQGFLSMFKNMMFSFAVEAGASWPGGAVNGAFAGTSQNVSGGYALMGGAATFSTDGNLTGLAVRLGPMVGVSFDTSLTVGCTLGEGCTK